MKHKTAEKLQNLVDRWNASAVEKPYLPADPASERDYLRRRYLATALRIHHGEKLTPGDALCWDFNRYGRPQKLLSRDLTRPEINEVCNELESGGFVFRDKEIIAVVTPAYIENERNEQALREERVAH